MSLFFNGASSVTIGSNLGASPPFNLVVSYPFTLSCWFFPTSTTGEQDLVFAKNVGANNGYWLGTSGTSIRAATWNGSVGTSATIPSAITINRWNHAAARFVSNTQRVVQINGGLGQSNNDNSNQTTQVIDELSIGSADFAGRYFNGYIAHVAIWNESIINADNATLGRGASPLYIRRQNLVAYWPMVNPGQQINIANAKSRAQQPLPLAPNRAGTGAQYSNWNPPVKTVLPTARIYRLPSAIVSGNNVPVLYHQRQQQGMAS